ncbi:MAG: type I methionyl aminopeptidase [Candidatus Omnitrophica bacterium]|nr:type I methionyl aminopeptidase [Candidatus Omnitrophota bacterium]MCM8777455.1 type I methionyl aminopeptidase [Candidatus Omnitrophota bacterium]
MVKTQKEIDKIRTACRICKSILIELGEMVKEGITTYDIEKKAEELFKKNSVSPAFENYRGYPAILCVSVNEEVVHGIPSKKKVLKEGDIVSIDIGVIYDGYYGDCADTFPVGKVKDVHRNMIDVARKSFKECLYVAIPGKKTGDIGATIENFVKQNKFSVVREFAGHGIGKELHEYPEIPNFGENGTGEILRENMVIAIEPMIIEHSSPVKILKDGWTVVTKNGSFSAHYENCILIKKEAPEILTE